jgi:hypothetical protein
MSAESKAKKPAPKGSARVTQSPRETVFDDETEAAVLKLVNGSSYYSLADEIKTINLTGEQKASLCRISICAAVGARKSLAATLPTDFAVVNSISAFMLNNQINYTKLVLIGHSLLRYTISGEVGVAWRAKLKGPLSIFETDDLSMFPDKRVVILKNLKAKAGFTRELVEAVYSAVVPPKSA